MFLKELDETAYWFELLTDSGIVVPAKLASLVNECDQLLAIFTTIAKKAKSTPSSLILQPSTFIPHPS